MEGFQGYSAAEIAVAVVISVAIYGFFFWMYYKSVKLLQDLVRKLGFTEAWTMWLPFIRFYRIVCMLEKVGVDFYLGSLRLATSIVAYSVLFYAIGFILPGWGIGILIATTILGFLPLMTALFELIEFKSIVATKDKKSFALLCGLVPIAFWVLLVKEHRYSKDTEKVKDEQSVSEV